jgi:exopolysaccharide biosynthesis polyprenyl glycosylphosphotransferase
VLTTVVDGGAAALTGLLLLPLEAALAMTVVWPVLLRLVPGAGLLPSGGRDRVLPVVRAAVVLGLVCWLAGSVVPLPGALVAFTVLAAAVSVVPRLGTGSRAVRALVVSDTGMVDPAEWAAGSEHRLAVAGACRPEELEATVRTVRPDVAVVVTCPRLSGRALQRLTWQTEALGLPMLLDSRLLDVSSTRTRVSRVGRLSLVGVAPAPRHGLRLLAKDVAERVAAALALLVLAPLLLALMLAVRLDSPGPGLFIQTRVGRHCRPFRMWKLRTMAVDAHALRDELSSESDGVLFKVRQDPRVTRLGRVLRRYSLDELPQLVNVVRGDMSLVGPRPALPEEVAAYDFDPRRRLDVKPGLTGLWQVSGRSELSWSETVRLDLDYVDNWSLPRDVGIVLRTVRAVLAHRGAY